MLQQIKSLFNPKEYFNSSIRLLERGGRHGSTNPPFSYRHSIQEFRSWVYAAAMINANAVAATPLRLYARRSAGTKGLWRTRPVSRKRLDYLNGELGGDHTPSRAVMTKVMDLGDDMEEITEMHPVKELLQKANHAYNGFDLTVLRTLYQELTGNAYLHPIIDQQLGIPVELWPMPAQWMQVIPSRENFIDGYSYGRTDVEALRFEVDEVIHFKRPNPDNLFYGLGKVEAAWGTVQANRAVHEMDLATFENHARPDYAVIVKGPHKRTDLDLFEQHVSERLRGTRKAGQFLAMSGDVNLMPLNFPPKDINGRDEIVEEIAAVFGVPVSMLKANDPNLASARAGFAQWRESTILPMLRMDEDVLNQTLLPMFGIEEDACLAYDNPVPADKEYELRERQAAVSGGWRTANEARKEEGKEEVEEEMADALMVGGMPLGAAAQMGMGMGMGMGAGMPPMPMGNGAPLPPGPEEEAPALPELPEAEVAEGAMQEPEVEQNFALNGAQISSIVEVLQNVASGIISRDAAIEVIVATGVGREQAVAMAASQQEEAVSPVEAEPIEDKAVEPSDTDLYDTIEEAERRAEKLGCMGTHEHEMPDGTVVYMPCGEMDEYTELTGLAHEKAISDVDLKPTDSMANFAERGLKLRQEHGRGGTEVGVARARDLKNKDTLSPETVRRMHSFFSRHRVDLQAPAAKPGHKEYPSAGVIAWLLWGGNPANPDGGGAGWAARKTEELDRAAKAKGMIRRKSFDGSQGTEQLRASIRGWLIRNKSAIKPNSVVYGTYDTETQSVNMQVSTRD